MKNNDIDGGLIILGFLLGFLIGVGGCAAILKSEEESSAPLTYTIYTTVQEPEYPTRDVTSAVYTLSASETLDIPDLPTDMKQYTDYRSYTLTYSDQYKIQTQSVTDSQGFRKYGSDYCVAMGRYYTEQCGDRFLVTLENGNSFTVITADVKQDIHTDETNMYSPCINYDNEPCANVLEFIIDKNAVPNELLDYGSVSWYDEFDGNITSIEYLGRT